MHFAHLYFFLIILNFYIIVDVHEVAYVAPSNLVRSRSRGIRKETEDDITLCKQIRKGISSAGLDLLWTGDQKQKFNEFKDIEFKILFALLSLFSLIRFWNCHCVLDLNITEHGSGQILH